MWDEEIGLYYLRSRYYDPSWGRFVNGDALLGNGGSLLSHNLYTYCENGPILRIDSNGTESVPVASNFITRQSDYSDKKGTFGPAGSLKWNGCGPMAIYNVNYYFRRQSPLETVVNKIEAGEWYFDGGLMGMDPRFIRQEFGYQGDSVTVYGKDMAPLREMIQGLPDLNAIGKHDAYIILYIWVNGQAIGAHYVSGFYSDITGEYLFLNDHGEFTVAKDFMEQFNRGNQLVVLVYGIDNHQWRKPVARKDTFDHSRCKTFCLHQGGEKCM